MSATVDVDGSVLFTINGDTGALALSDVNLSTLEQLPNCSVGTPQKMLSNGLVGK